MFMRVCFQMLVCMAAAARAADLSAVYPYQQSPVLYGDLREEEPATFWEQFNVSFEHRAPGVFEDQFSATACARSAPIRTRI
jgi:hypothetical protein